jgi:hypothetical protein
MARPSLVTACGLVFARAGSRQRRSDRGEGDSNLHAEDEDPVKKKINPLLSKYLSKIGKRGGTVSSERKAAAARENGKTGGRPRKQLKPA